MEAGGSAHAMATWMAGGDMAAGEASRGCAVLEGGRCEILFRAQCRLQAGVVAHAVRGMPPAPCKCYAERHWGAGVPCAAAARPGTEGAPWRRPPGV
jgi:hypothetical protein